MYKINPLLNRPSPSLVAELAAFGVAIIADAMGRYGAMKPYIKPIHRGARLAGPALTVQTFRADNLMLHMALELAQAGDVLVVDAGEVENAGLWGGLMNTMAVKKNLGGLVTDGAVRDSEELIEMVLPVFSKSISPLGGYKDAPGSVNIPISCGGIVVRPGDIIVGDDDGVAVIPLDSAEEVLGLCRRTFAKEAHFREEMEKGTTLFQLLGLSEQLEKLGLPPLSSLKGDD